MMRYGWHYFISRELPKCLHPTCLVLGHFQDTQVFSQRGAL